VADCVSCSDYGARSTTQTFIMTVRATMKTLNLTNGVWRYDEAKLIGGPGSFAAVYAGLSADDDPVAIKLFHGYVGQDANRELQFASMRLGRTASHVINIYDCGIDVGSSQPAVVMAKGEYNLSQHSRAHGALAESAACEIALAIVEGLLEVSDWVHRDLKPANVIWCDEGWKLVDFGIARIADASTAAGTMKNFLSAHYAAPEQWNSEHATHATDVYALGCIIHELLTGKTLFDGTTQIDLARCHRLEPAPINAGSSTLQSFLHRMVAKPQFARPSLEEVRRRLQTFAGGGSNGGRPASVLSAVSAAVSSRQAEQDAAVAQAKRSTHTRSELSDQAFRLLLDIQKDLFDRIRDDAPAATIKNVGSSNSPVLEASLGHGTLTMSVGHMRDVPKEVFSMSGWDVICWDIIRCWNPGYDRGASLWYVNDGSGQWRWLEAAYFCWGRNSGVNEPCSLPPGDDADTAASNVMGAWNIAHPRRVVDDDDEREAFIERWISYLAQAAEGRLRKPASLPEE
jgi:eukaryotic-like serine/threonine-protein kinase